MASDADQIAPPPGGEDRAGTTALIEALVRFDGPPGEFLARLLAVQCRLAAAEAGAIFRPGPDGRPQPVAVFPPVAEGGTAPVWLAEAAAMAPEAAAGAATSVRPVHGPGDLYGQPAASHLVLIPLKGERGVRGLAAYHVRAAEAAAVAASRDRLELSVSLLSLYEMRLTLQRRRSELRRLRAAMELSASVNAHDRFMAAAMALCNEAAARWGCERVSLGFLKGRYVKVRAVSHTEKFSGKMELVRAIESAMEECLDQDVEAVHPSGADSPYVTRSAAELSRRHGPSAVISLPLRRDGEPVAVLTCERAAEAPFDAEQAEALRLAVDLCTPRLLALHEGDRWFGARAAAGLRKLPARVIGPRHTWVKLAAVAVFAAAAFLVFARGDYHVEAPMALQAVQRRSVPAPYDGFLDAVHVEPGDQVVAGRTVLAELDTAELRSQLLKARADRKAHLTRAAAALRDGRTAEAQIARADAAKVDAEVDLLARRIDQARLVAPIGGTVLTGEWADQIDAPVRKGQVLFEIAPLDRLRAELSVPEDVIADVRAGRRGELAPAAAPSRRVGFVVERVGEVAEVVDRRNVFRVRVRLDALPDGAGLKPGMKGLAKVRVGRRRYAWMWTRRLINWLRMKLWW